MACSESNTFFLSKLHASCLINQIISPYFIRIIPTIVDNLSVFLKIGKIPHRISALIVDNPWIFFIFGYQLNSYKSSKMGKFKILFIFLFTLTACQTGNEKYIEMIKNEGLVTEIESFNISYEFRDGPYTYLNVDIQSRDTLIDLSLIYQSREPLIVKRYSKYYKDKELKYNVMEFDQNKDSLFWIRSSDPNVPYKEFVFGEYNFMYIYDLLTEGQRRFFEMHRDSLAKVRGFSLPPLPELSENPGKI
jgi:hypothetical protein